MLTQTITFGRYMTDLQSQDLSFIAKWLRLACSQPVVSSRAVYSSSGDGTGSGSALGAEMAFELLVALNTLLDKCSPEFAKVCSCLRGYFLLSDLYNGKNDSKITENKTKQSKTK
jgi:hypothetical protein